jgi:hypothetical protein
LPPYREVRGVLVPYDEVTDFAVAGPLSIWGGENLFAKTPCVFVSHRWLSPDHPDPSAVQLQDLKHRFGASLPLPGSVNVARVARRA